MKPQAIENGAEPGNTFSRIADGSLTVGCIAGLVAQIDDAGLDFLKQFVESIQLAKTRDELIAKIREEMKEFATTKETLKEIPAPLQFPAHHGAHYAHKGLDILLRKAPDSWLGQYLIFATNVIHGEGIEAIQLASGSLSCRFADLFNAAAYSAEIAGSLDYGTRLRVE